jgi:prepilin-type N-terminal cleavage/methylation domain-containing protein/prepilin-type processing-associated H-X9-DG protein
VNDRPDPFATTQAIKKSPRAFTLVELLVVIAIVGALAALVIPAVQSATLSARSAGALSSLKQTGVFVASYTADNSGRLPLSMYWGGWWFQKFLNEYSSELKNKPYNKSLGLELHKIFYDPVLKGKREHPYGSFGVNSTVVFDSNLYNAKYGLGSASSDGVGMPFDMIPTPSQKVIVCSAIEGSWASSWGFAGNTFVQNGFDPTYGPDPRHGGKAGALFADGHVEKLDVKNMDQATRKKHFTLDP